MADDMKWSLADYDAIPGTAHAMPSTQTATPGRLARPTTAADRPSVTDDARAERPLRCDGTPHPEGAIPPLSEHDYRWDGDDPYVVCARCGERRDALTASRVLDYHRRAETATATTEDAVERVFQTTHPAPNTVMGWIRAGYEAGLLATARTRPTREAIEEAIEAGKVAHDDAVAAGGAVGPQNDYIAEEVDALLNHDQPTEAEAGARALVHAAGDHFHAMVAAGAGNPGEVSTWLRERAASLRGGAR